MIEVVNHICYYTAKEINAKINQIEKPPAVIIGNGINAEAGAFKGGWKSLIWKIASELDKKIGVNNCDPDSLLVFVDRILSDANSSSVTLPELYDWLLIKYENLEKEKHGPYLKEKESYSSKENVDKVLEEVIRNEEKVKENTDGMTCILKWCIEKKADILTTNYDSFLHSIDGITHDQKYKDRNKKKEKKDTDTFPFAHSFLLEGKSNLWYINGCTKKASSLRLSLRDYHNYISKIKSTGLIYNKETNNWIRQFVERPLIFAGLSLDSQEEILRMLLIERMRYYIVTEKDLPPKSYFIQYNSFGSVGMNNVKREFLKDLGVSVLELQCGEKLSNCFKN